MKIGWMKEKTSVVKSKFFHERVETSHEPMCIIINIIYGFTEDHRKDT